MQSLNNQRCMIQPTIINLHPHEYSQGLRQNTFVVSFYRCAGSYNILNDLSNREFSPNKT